MELQQKTPTGEVGLRQNRALVVGYPDELRLQPTNEVLLRKITEVTVGKYDPSIEELLAADERTVRRRLPLWPYLLMAVLGIFVIDVLLRRIDLSGLRFWARKPILSSENGASRTN